MTTVEILQEARALIASPDNWARGFYSMNAKGEFVATTSSDAVRWCARGALMRVSKDPGQPYPVDSVAVHELHHTAELMGYHTLVHLNDSGTHEEVLAAFDETIRRLSDG